MFSIQRLCVFSVSRSILEMSTFRQPCSPLHQDEEQTDTELFLQVIPFLYYATCWSGGGKVENCESGGMEMGEIDFQ